MQPDDGFVKSWNMQLINLPNIMITSEILWASSNGFLGNY